jgi:CHAD domain-containing protein
MEWMTMAGSALSNSGIEIPPALTALQRDREASERDHSEESVPHQRAELARKLLPPLGLREQDLMVAFQLADAVETQRTRFNRMVARCQKHFSEESVHNARVACRRLIARLLMVRAAAPDPTIDKVLRQLKRFLKNLGTLRDIQVQKQHFNEDLRNHHEISGLWIELGQKELDLIKSVQEKLSRFKLRKLNRRVRAVEEDLADPTARLATKAAMCASVVDALETAYAAVLRRKEAIDPSVPATVHQTRIAYKKYRYMVESLPPAICRPSSVQLSAMAEYQTAMGVIQDTEVSITVVKNYGNRFPLLAGDLVRYERELARRMEHQINEYLDRADVLSSFWPLESPPPTGENAGPAAA